MKLWNVCLVCVFAGLGVIPSSMAAKAINFNFSYQGVGSNPGMVTGVIQGRQDNVINKNLDSIKLILYSNPLDLAVGSIFNYQSGEINVFKGEIQAISTTFVSEIGYYSLILNNNQLSAFNPQDGSLFFVYNKVGFDGVSYTQLAALEAAVAIPWEINPAAGAAVGVPLFMGLRILSYKKLTRRLITSKTTKTVS